MAKGHLQINKLHKSLGSHFANDSLSIDVTNGTIFGLGSLNGVGKPSVLNAIRDLCKERAGRIEVAAEDVKPIHPPARLSTVRIACLLQENSIFADIRAEKNLRLLGRRHKQPPVTSTAAEPELGCNPLLGGVCAAAGRATHS